MPTVRYTDDGGRYRVADETFHPGDEAEVSDGLASHLVDDVGRFERVDSDDASPDSEDADDEAADADDVLAPFHPRDNTVAEIEELVESNDYSDAELEALADAERANDNRLTAIESIEEA